MIAGSGEREGSSSVCQTDLRALTSVPAEIRSCASVTKLRAKMRGVHPSLSDELQSAPADRGSRAMPM